MDRANGRCPGDESGARILGPSATSLLMPTAIKNPYPARDRQLHYRRKAMASARTMLGEEGLRHSTYMHAHGTGTRKIVSPNRQL